MSQCPLIRLKAKQRLGEASLDDLNIVPKKFESALRNLASKPMFSRNKFMEDLIKLTGGTENYLSQMKAYEHTSWTQRKHLDISWIDVVVKAVFQRPANEKYVRYEKEDVQELLNEVLALHGAGYNSKILTSRFSVLTVKTEILLSKSIPRVLANIQDLLDTLRIPYRGH